MMKHLWVLMLFFCFSCSSKSGRDAVGKSDARLAVTVDLVDYIEGEKEDEIALSGLVDSLVYIPLQTPDDLPVDVLLAVKMSPDEIFVMDRQQKLYRFDSHGRFLNLIGSRGEGPSEYVSAVDFEIDASQDVVYLFDIYRKKIKVYQMSGAFVQDIVVPDGVESMALLNDTCFIGYRPWYATVDKSDECVVFGKSEEVYRTISFEPKENVEGVKIDLFRMPDFSQLASSSRFRMPFEHSVFLISDNNRVSKDVVFDMGKYLLPMEVSMNNELYNKNLNSSYIFELNANRISDFIYMSFFYKRKHYRVVYDIVHAKFYTVFVGHEPKGIKNDLDGGATFWPMWFASDRMIGVVPADELEDTYVDSKIKVLYDNFRDYDNPVLQIGYHHVPSRSGLGL